MERKLISFFITWLLLSVSIYAQTPPSYKTQTIDGVEYYVYHVKQSEGLYRISVNFGVTQDEITRINPEVKDGLKAGQILFIPKKDGITPTQSAPAAAPQNRPVQDKTPHEKPNDHAPMPVDLIASALGGQQPTTPANSPKTAQPVNAIQLSDGEPNFYYHKVRKKQTLYSLSKEYGVKQEDIVKYNPQTASGLRENEVLRIPKPEDIYPDKKVEKMQEDLSVKYMIHKVEPKETLYSISKRHEVEIDDILKLNPGLEVLSIGQELKIPYYTALIATDTIDGKARTFLDWEKIFGKKDTVKTAGLRLAFLLPFVLENKDDANITRFVDFYGGAVKALCEAKSRGISIDVYTYDTGKTPEKMQEIFSDNPQLKDMDLIIGPAYSAQVPVATAFAKEHRVKTLIPFTSKVADIDQNPYIFQFNPGTDVELDFLKYMFKTRLDKMNYIFADIQYVPSVDEGSMLSRQIKEILDEMGKEYRTIDIIDPEVNLFDSVAVQDQRNLIIFNTDQFQVAQPYFENLNMTDRRHDILLLERYSWKNQESFRPVGVYVSAFKTESDMTGLEKYEADFTNLLGWKAIAKNPRYDILGYDLVSYFIHLLVSEDKDMDEKLELEMYSEGLQSQFRFKRHATTAGFINQQVYLGDSQVK